MPHPGVIIASAVVVALGAIVGAAYYAFCEDNDQRQRQYQHSQRIPIDRGSNKSVYSRSNRVYAYSDCPICLDSLAGKVTEVLKCCHEFHADCINRWFRTNDAKSCPLCLSRN